MLVTEEEAKTKLCQETFAPFVLDGDSRHDVWACQASGCMAWRWQDVLSIRDGQPHGGLGYCGKAGKL